MLSPQSAVIIKATLPAVGAAIEEITSRFYATLFADHPALERDLFNRGNQAQGDQQRALAGAVASFATLLVVPDAPAPDKILSRIANKHASLGITADQYEVVHDYLFAAIVEVLGEAVTAEVAAAWNEVYWLMADSLVLMETGLYAQAGVEPGDVWLPVKVLTRTQESPDCIALTIGGVETPLPPFRPGQYTSIAVTLPDGARQIRQYSITGSARDSSMWRVTIKRVASVEESPAGQVSNHIHDTVFEGDVLTVSRPFGDLTLADEQVPVLMVSAGIGCTPMIGMLRHLVETGDERPVAVVHADRSPSVQAHRSELTDLVGLLPAAIMQTWYSDIGLAGSAFQSGPADLSSVALTPGLQVYLCGPLPFMRSMREQLVGRGVPAADIHYEVFGPDLWLQVA